eukprot:6407982-Alexandrium_andersonii.AAC.1
MQRGMGRSPSESSKAKWVIYLKSISRQRALQKAKLENHTSEWQCVKHWRKTPFPKWMGAPRVPVFKDVPSVKTEAAMRILVYGKGLDHIFNH